MQLKSWVSGFAVALFQHSSRNLLQLWRFAVEKLNSPMIIQTITHIVSWKKFYFVSQVLFKAERLYSTSRNLHMVYSLFHFKRAMSLKMDTYWSPLPDMSSQVENIISCPHAIVFPQKERKYFSDITSLLLSCSGGVEKTSRKKKKKKS